MRPAEAKGGVYALDATPGSKADIINKLLITADNNENPISVAKARRYAERILRGDTPAEITNNPRRFRHITWADPTGEQAVRNVLDDQHNRKAAA